MNIIAKLGGRKFLMAIFGVIAVVAQSHFGVSEQTTMTVAGVIAAYIFGQGVADGLSGGATSSNPTPPNKDVG